MKYFNTIIKNLTRLISSLLILLSCCASALPGQSPVATGYLPGMAPLIYREHDGRIKGLAADYFSQFSKSHPDVLFSYQLFTDEQSLCNAFKKGKVKIALGFTQYSGCKLSSDPPVLWSSSMYEVRNRKKGNASTDIVYYSDVEIDGLTLAALYPHATLISTNDEQTIVEALLTRKNIVYVSSLLHADPLLAEYPNFLTANLLENIGKVRYALRISWQMQTAISAPLAEYIHNQVEHMPNNHETKWFNYANFHDQKPLNLSYEQQQWIKAHPVIRVAVPRYSYPVGYIDDNESFQGISAEILKSVSKRTGLTFVSVPVLTVGEMINDIKNHRVDMGAHRSVGDTTDMTIFSDPFLMTRFVAMVRKDDNTTSELSSLNNRRIAIAKGQTLKNYFIDNIAGAHITTINGAMVNGLNLIVNNTADAIIAPEIIANYWVGTYYAGKIKNVPLAIPAISIAFPIRQDYGMLKSIINDSIADIPYSRLREVDPHWTENISPPTTIIPKMPLFIGLAIASFLALMIVTSLIIYRVKFNKQQRINLERYNNTLTTILDSTPFPVYIADRTGKLLFRNEALQYVMINKEFSPADTDNLFRLFNESTVIVRQIHDLALEKHGDIMYENRFTLCGQSVFLKFWALPIDFQESNETHILGGWIDLTEKKLLEDSLKHEKQIAINNAEAKTLFLAQISHEIRTPLSIIIGLMEIISSKAASISRDRLEHQAQIAFRNSSSLLGLLDQLITFAKEGCQYGKSADEKAQVNLQELVDDTLALFSIRAEEKGLEFLRHFDSSCGTQFMCDRLKIQQLLNNLLSNALKFTLYGSVSVSTHIRPVSRTHSAMSIEVKDTGPGIREEHIERIFEVFEQEDTLTSSQYGGYGLGLAICRQLSLALGGTITLTSQYGQGTCVTMNLPLQHARLEESVLQLPLQPPDFSQLHVAIIEDNRASRFLLKTQLETLGVTVSEVNTICELDALYLANTPDAIISDYELRTFTGIDVLKHLRCKFVFSPLCYIYTANADRKDGELYIDSGATGVILKPVSIQHLTIMLSDIISKQPVQRFMRQIERLASGRYATVKAMLHELSESIREDVAILRQADYGDETLLRQHVHSLKGALSMIKRPDIVSCCDDYLDALHSTPERRSTAWLAMRAQLDNLLGMIEECTENL